MNASGLIREENGTLNSSKILSIRSQCSSVTVMWSEPGAPRTPFCESCFMASMAAGTCSAGISRTLNSLAVVAAKEKINNFSFYCSRS